RTAYNLSGSKCLNNRMRPCRFLQIVKDDIRMHCRIAAEVLRREADYNFDRIVLHVLYNLKLPIVSNVINNDLMCLLTGLKLIIHFNRNRLVRNKLADSYAIHAKREVVHWMLPYLPSYALWQVGGIDLLNRKLNLLGVPGQ